MPTRFSQIWIGMAHGVLCLALLGGCVPYPVYNSRDPGSASRPVNRAPVEKDRSATIQSSPETRPSATGAEAEPATVRAKTEPVSLQPLDPGQIDTVKAYQVGFASYYGEELHGRKTSSGSTYNRYKMTAAHRVLPLGTRIKVTNLENGRWVEVEVNDRGPFEEERILDLSFAAALELEIVKTGKARVMIEVIEMVD